MVHRTPKRAGPRIARMRQPSFQHRPPTGARRNFGPCGSQQRALRPVDLGATCALSRFPAGRVTCRHLPSGRSSPDTPRARPCSVVLHRSRRNVPTPTDHIVDHPHQITHWAAAFEPIGIGGVPLHQFAEPRSPLPPNVHILDRLRLALPQPAPIIHPRKVSLPTWI